MRFIGAMFAVMLLAAPAFAGENEQGNNDKEQARKEQDARRKEEMKKKEELKKKEEMKKDPVEEKIGKLIKDQDKDGDGAIGETEAKGDIKAKFGELDSNDDNKVTPDEIREFIKKRAEEEHKRKQEKQPAPKKDEPRREDDRKDDRKKEEENRKQGERPKKD